MAYQKLSASPISTTILFFEARKPALTNQTDQYFLMLNFLMDEVKIREIADNHNRPEFMHYLMTCQGVLNYFICMRTDSVFCGYI